jgi:rare lipoprotein A
MLAVCLMPTGPLRAEASDPVEAAAEAEDLAPVLEPIGSGIASYYGRELAGARTASGQRFDPAGYTAAHRTLPFGTQVQVTNAATGDSVVVTINDRGPFRSNRVLDMSEAAARRIGLIRAGHGTVRLAVVHPAG